MMKKLLSLALLMATAALCAQSDLTVQIIKNDGSIVSETVKFTENGMQHEVDGLVFEVVTVADQEPGFALLELKIYRGRDEQGELVLYCQGAGKVELNKEQVVNIAEKTNDDEVIQTITLTFLVTE